MTNLHYDPRLKQAEVGRGRTRMRSKESDASPVAIICLKSFLLFALKLRKIKIMFLTPATPHAWLLLPAPPQLELKKSPACAACESLPVTGLTLPPLLLPCNHVSSICPECHNFYVKASRMSLTHCSSSSPDLSDLAQCVQKKICATNLRPYWGRSRRGEEERTGLGACTVPHFMTVFSLLASPLFLGDTKYFYSSISICKEGCMTDPTHTHIGQKG